MLPESILAKPRSRGFFYDVPLCRKPLSGRTIGKSPTIGAFASQKAREGQPILCSINMYCTTYLLSIQYLLCSRENNTGIKLPKADSGLNFSIVGIRVNSLIATLIRFDSAGKEVMVMVIGCCPFTVLGL